MQSWEDVWEQNYEDMMGSIPDLFFDDVSPARSPSPKASCKGPKGGVGKAVRRRSRSSKKAPTTLLTADANNFRALVQQFTGCHSATPLLRAYRGPINLNFKQCTYYPQQHNQPKESKMNVPTMGMGQIPLTLDNFWEQEQEQEISTAALSAGVGALLDHDEFWGY